MTETSMKPRIAIVADVKNWAFANIARQIEKYLSGKCVIQILYLEDYPNLSALYHRLFLGSPFDLVHFLWRETALNTELVRPFYHDPQERLEQAPLYAAGLLKTAITTSVYDHLFLAPEEIKDREFQFNYLLDGYSVCSQKLFDIYKGIEGYPVPDAVIEDGVDPAFFFPKDLERFRDGRNELVVGWVGNSKWGMEQGTDRKGLHSIIKPALENLRRQNLPVKGVFADRNERFVPLEQMVDYYRQIDVLVCASDAEGTPNPVLEAMACGVPVVSTDVGIVPQVFGELQAQFILPERSPRALENKLKQLIERPELRASLSEENLGRIRGWTREQESQKWERFFLTVLERQAEAKRHEEVPLTALRLRFRRFMAEESLASTSERERTVRHLNAMIEDRDGAIRSMTKMIDDRDAYIKVLENRLNSPLRLSKQLAKQLLARAVRPW